MAINIEVVQQETVVEVVTGGFVNTGVGGDWNTLINRPATFPPAAHPHVIADVTGLQAALDNAGAANAVMLTGAQTVGGVKTFTSSPIVPGGSWTIASTTGLQDALDLKAPLANPTFTGTVAGITKSMVGLANVDNTTDANKPISTATQTALNLKAPLASPTFTGTVSGITKAMVGLANVDNTTDANKPVSTATQTALNLKANLASPTFTGTVAGITAAMVGLGNVNNTADTAKPVSTAQQAALDLKANLASPTFTGTVAGITKAMVGLSAVDNTSDANKPVSSATQTALGLKADLASPTFTGTVGGITAAMVGLGSVNNTSDLAKPVSTATQAALDNKANLTSPSFTGTLTAINIATGTLRVGTSTTAGWVLTADSLGNATWAAPTGGSGGGGTGDVTTNTAQTISAVKTFTAIPIVPTNSWTIANTNGLQSALDAKAPLASPTFTGTVSGITKTMVGLGNVTNVAQVELTGAQTIAGVKTFSSSPVVPDGSFTIAKTTNLQSTLDAKAAAVHTHDISSLTDIAEGGFTTPYMPSGYIIWVSKADNLYGAAGSWPATRPGRADQYCHFIGDTDPGTISQDHDLWTAV